MSFHWVTVNRKEKKRALAIVLGLQKIKQELQTMLSGTLCALQRNLEFNLLILGNLIKRWCVDSREVEMQPWLTSTSKVLDSNAWWFRWQGICLKWGKQVQPPGQEYPVEKEMATYSSILAGRIPWQRKLAGYSLWGYKVSDVTDRLTLTN